MIDERSDIHPSAAIADNVTIGPWSVIGENVAIGEGTWIGPHVVIRGPTKIGRNNKIYQFASVGEDTQDKKYRGEETWLEIGDNNVVREFCTLNRGTAQGGGVTKIGNGNLLMAYVHVAHDCIIHNDTVFANNASLAGHVEVCDYAILSGFSGVHQFCVIGEYSFIAKGALIAKDVPPYMLVAGIEKPSTYGLNIEGLRRHNFSKETIALLRRAYKAIYRQGLTLANAIDDIKSMAPDDVNLQRLVEFLQRSQRGIV